ncbi:hypothetical protein QJS10_CPA10g01904 [Acorus calamus]|uniref:BAG domain-containing protein n=1 Tax=Acorus calamus TaxID=4465 RepID=A0AAV9E0K4_ACOCL|nr:hypothetical protein QJS10_CPA10g01904 [Acorus calamus]
MRSTHITSSTFIHLTIQNDQTTPPSKPIPIDIPNSSPVSIPVALPRSTTAIKIQATYRSHLTRSLVRRISAVDSEATRLERLIQSQDTVDAVRSDERERLRLSEALMRLLFSLDSVPGFFPAVRDLRRRVSRRIVGLQEILDAVVAMAEEAAVGVDRYFPASLEEIVSRGGSGRRLKRVAMVAEGTEEGLMSVTGKGFGTGRGVM